MQRTNWRAFALALTIATVAACSSTASSSAGNSATSSSGTSSAVNLSSVTLNVGDQKGTGAEALLTAADLIKTLPFKVAWSDFTSGPSMVQAMSTGSVDIGGVGDAPPVFAASGGENIKIVGARQTPAGDADAIVVPKNSPITSISQLRGKKIAVSFGSSDDYQLLTVLTRNGLTTKDVGMVNLQPGPALAAFTSGSVDAWDIWPPYVQQVVKQDNARIVITGQPYGSPYSFEVASKAALADQAKAAAIASYLTTLNKAYVWAGKHVSEWATIWGNAAGLPASVMNEAARVSVTTPVPITSAIITSEQNVVDQFYAAALIPTKVDISGYITTQFNSTASAGASS